MELYKYVATLIFCNNVYGRTIISTDGCGGTANCFCKRSIYETQYQCPDAIAPKIIVTVGPKHNAVEIYCPKTLDWHKQELPLLNIKYAEYVTFRQCPFPTHFVEIITKLKVNSTKELRFNNAKKFASITLTTDYFKGLHGLERLILNSSNINDVNENAFQLLDKLVDLQVDYNNIQLKDDMFKNLSKLKFLSLTFNEISHLPEHIFWYTKKLQKLDLKSNKIRDLPPTVFSALIRLKTLILENNLIINIESAPFRKLQSLEILSLSNNKIKFVDKDAFRMAYSLKEILLANNNFDLPKHEHSSLFKNNQDLEKLDLSNNTITEMDNFHPNINLVELDLSYNQIAYISFGEVFTAASALHINLTYNNITTVDFTGVNFDQIDSSNGNRKMSLNGNPINCNCYIYNFVRYFDQRAASKLITIQADKLICSSPKELINSIVTKINLNLLTCSFRDLAIEGKYTDKCLYKFRLLDKSLIMNCSNANFTEPPELILPTENFFEQIEVYLENNFLTSGPTENMGYENVTKLFLSSNNITGITWIPPKLQVLELHKNRISFLNYEVLTKLNSSILTDFTLGQNPWNCNCSLVNLTSFIVSSSGRKYIDDINLIECEDSRKIVDLRSDDICPNNTTVILGLCVTFFLTILLISIIIAVYYRFQQEVKVWLFAHNMFIWFVTEDEIDKDKLYDAFVSYSHKDEDFVLNELLPVLEKGNKQYKVCVHIRDWIAGEFIAKQIATSVTKSRRTVVVLSRHFLKSEWGKMEFRTAHTKAIQEGRARVILIIYGNIDINSDLDDELKAYVRTNTYVKWGDPWFWDKLRYALPHSRERKPRKTLYLH